MNADGGFHRHSLQFCRSEEFAGQPTAAKRGQVGGSSSVAFQDVLDLEDMIRDRRHPAMCRPARVLCVIAEIKASKKKSEEGKKAETGAAGDPSCDDSGLEQGKEDA